MKYFLFVTGFLILLITEIARVYFIMPFPGSQVMETIGLAYFIQSNLGLLRLAGFLLIAYPLYQFLFGGSRKVKVVIGLCLTFYAVIFYFFNFEFLAEKMFYQPKMKIMAGVQDNKIPVRQLVVGVTINGEAKAYPIELIGYHHQVRDTVGGEPIMVTYCTVCRTGRIFSPFVGGEPENFRLVGMDHFNAMFEDGRTGSWWRQVNGEAIAGKLKGQKLREIPSEQMRLEAWIDEHNNTLIMQPDTTFREEYAWLRNYDEGTGKGKLTRTDSLSWRDKSWVVGVPIGQDARAYDWIELKTHRVVNDELASTPLVVTLANDTVSFHAWQRVSGRDTLSFIYGDSTMAMIDKNTNSVWDWSGKCVGGKMKGTQLQALQSYQEFWHSWRTFHPQTTQYAFKQ